MKMLRLIASLFTLIAGPLLLSACEKPPLYVDQAWVRISPNPASPSAGYFTIHGGGDDVTLRGVTTDAALKVEMHESMSKGGMMTMKAIDSVAVPAGSTVKFEPGGKHLMLWTVNPTIIESGKISLTFIFSNGERIIVDAMIQKPGGGTPETAAMGGDNMAAMNMSEHAGH